MPAKYSTIPTKRNHPTSAAHSQQNISPNEFSKHQTQQELNDAAEVGVEKGGVDANASGSIRRYLDVLRRYRFSAIGSLNQEAILALTGILAVRKMLTNDSWLRAAIDDMFGEASQYNEGTLGYYMAKHFDKSQLNLASLASGVSKLPLDALITFDGEIALHVSGDRVLQASSNYWLIATTSKTEKHFIQPLELRRVSDPGVTVFVFGSTVCPRAARFFASRGYTQIQLLDRSGKIRGPPLPLHTMWRGSELSATDSGFFGDMFSVFAIVFVFLLILLVFAWFYSQRGVLKE